MFELSIGPLTYSVKKSPHEDVVTEDGESAYGVTNHDTLMIDIAEDMPASLERMILTHEILHTFFFLNGIVLDFDEEEKMVRSLAPLLFQFIRDNPEIVKYLQDAKI